MNWTLQGVAVVLMVIGLVGQGFEMRKIRQSLEQEGNESSSPKVFTDKRNLKWYVIIFAAIIVYYVSEGL